MSLFHVIDNIIECILCVPYHILSVLHHTLPILPYTGVGDFTKWEMKFMFISTFKFRYMTEQKLPFFVTITVGWVGHE